jgi:hypothetical protein
MENKMLKLMEAIVHKMNCIDNFKEVINSELNELLCTFSFFNEYVYAVVQHKETLDVFVFIESTKFGIVRCMKQITFSNNTGLRMIEQITDFDIVSQTLFGVKPKIVDGYRYNPNLPLGFGYPLSLKFYCDIINYRIMSSNQLLSYSPKIVKGDDDDYFRISLNNKTHEYNPVDWIEPTKELLHPNAISIFYSLTVCANNAYNKGVTNGIKTATDRMISLVARTMNGKI